MKMSITAVALAAVLSMLSPASVHAATILNTAGTRGVTISYVQPLGQSFTAIDTSLTSIGFQFSSLNPGSANDPVTLTLRAGESLTGQILASVTATLPSTIATRTPTFFDFAFDNVPLTVGGIYTAVLTTSTSPRLAVAYGPLSTNTATPLGPDAYAGGKLLAGMNDPDAYGFCGKSGQCDLNFRITGVTATAAVPEPASWALLIGGFGLIGGVLRRRAPATATA